MWIQTGKERQIVINYIKMRGEDFSYTNFHSVVPVEEDKDGFVTIAKKFRKQILTTSGGSSFTASRVVTNRDNPENSKELKMFEESVRGMKQLWREKNISAGI